MFSFLGSRDLKSCCCVCKEWKELILGSRILKRKRKNLDLNKKIEFQYCFDNKAKGIDIDPYGICIVPKKNILLVTDYCNHRVIVFNEQGHVVTCFGSEGKELGQLRNPRGIHVFESSILVVDYGNCRVQIFDLEYNPRQCINTGRFDPIHVCVHNQQILVITMNHVILVFDLYGNPIKQLDTDNIRQSTHDSLRGICVNSVGQIITNIGHNEVNILDKNWNILSSFSQQEEKSCFLASSIRVDKMDNILVADYINLKISIFNSDGTRFLQQIKVPDKEGIYDFCICKQKIIVTGHNKVFVFS